MITHLEPDLLECEVRWALESITTNKASGGDGTPAEPFHILKEDAVKVLHSVCQQFGKLNSGHRTEKVSFHSNPEQCSNYWTIALISHASKVFSKFSKLDFNRMWTNNFQIFKLDLEKADEPEIILPTSTGS